MKLDKYYFYIEKERTRVFTDKSNGEPLEFEVAGVKTTELYNTFRYDISKKEYIIKFLNRPYEQGFDNIYNLRLITAGYYNRANPNIAEFFHMKALVNLLQVREAEIRILLSYSYWKNMADYGAVLDKTYYPNLFKIINDDLGSNFECKGSYFIMPLVENLFYFLSLGKPNNLLYIDEKNAICNKKDMYSRGVVWGINSPFVENQCDLFFIDYLKKEELFEDEKDYDNIKSYVMHEAKKGNDVSTVTINRRDERIQVDCQILREFIKASEEYKYKELQDFIVNNHLINDKTMCLLNIHNPLIKEKVLKIIEEKQLKIYEEKNYFTILLKFCEVIDKYNSSKYMPKIVLKVRKQGKAIQDFKFYNKLYNVRILFDSQKEESEVCKFLGLRK